MMNGQNSGQLDRTAFKRIAVVTPVHDRREITLQCLRSLSKASTRGIDLNIYVVDDGSTDGSAEAIRTQFPHVNIIPGSGDLWYTEGSNVGIRAALKDGTDYVLAINDDSVFEPHFLEYLLETAEKYERSVVGPLLLLWDVPHKLFQTAPVWSTLAGGWKHWQYQTVWTVPAHPWEVDLIVGNCVLYPRSCFDNCGFMDSKRFPNFGDAEYTPRLQRAGYKLVVDPRSRVFCQPNAIPQRLRDKNPASLFRELVLDLKQPGNLTRTFLSHIRGGPSAFQGVAAFFVLLVRIGLQALTPRTMQTTQQDEPPLYEVFASNVLAPK